MSTTLKKHKRWTAKRKFEAALELINDHKTLNELSRDTGQPAHILSQWRDDFLSYGDAIFKEPETSKEKALGDESRHLKTKIGDQAMGIDLLYDKVKHLENGASFHLRTHLTHANLRHSRNRLKFSPYSIRRIVWKRTFLISIRIT